MNAGSKLPEQQILWQWNHYRACMVVSSGDITQEYSCTAQDTLVGADGKEIKLHAPTGDELPSRGFDPGALCL